MDSTTAVTTTPPFLRLTPAIREKIYSHLLAPHPSESTTTINYELSFPHLQHPSSTTFTPHQLDICRCPQSQYHPQHYLPLSEPSRPNDSDTSTAQTKASGKPHIYIRYTCTPPQVSIRPGLKWLLQSPGPAFNILRPATSEDLLLLCPSTPVLYTNRLIFEEAMPFLYQKRTFHLLTGICSRGRYAAYATLVWLKSLSPLARKHVERLRVGVWRGEEDCVDSGAEEAYRALAEYIVGNLPAFECLWLEGWDEGGDVPVWVFVGVFEKEGVRICLTKRVEDGGNGDEEKSSGEAEEGEVQVFKDAESFLEACGVEEVEVWETDDEQSGDDSGSGESSADRGEEDWEIIHKEVPGAENQERYR